MTTAEAAGRLHDELAALYGRLYRRALVRERAGAELTRSDYGLLKHVECSGPCRAGDIAADQGTDPSTVSRRVLSLQERGFLVRTTDEADRRAHVLTLTPEGGAALERERATRRTELQDGLSDWSASDLDDLARLLHRLNDSLTEGSR